ncbi:hypothetical protein [Clostridium algidicarnis]|uniref:hypothetical protein n=1 Tax=Clostridium algidicarnis TaxID=37659 RepID=UPI000A49C66A|nr:hypothetical protein [Clostridium algidicarnis]
MINITSGIYVDLDKTTPRYGCTYCNRCNSLFGVSLCKIKNRGCCFYFPKFYLVDLHNMCKSIDGLQTLHSIVNNPGTILHEYYIHAKGYFDKEGYENYMSNNYFDIDSYSNNNFKMVINEANLSNELTKINDKTMFFRCCPFAKEGYGCTIPAKYRTYVCNFFLCSEVIDSIKELDNYDLYVRERERYMRWLDFENQNLEHILRENHLSLSSNLEGVIKALQELPKEDYEFPKLPPIITSDNLPKNA